MLIISFVLLSVPLWSQGTNEKSDNVTPSSPRVVVVTGNRFSYKLVQKWIDEYNKVNPDVQIIIEARGTNDPAKFQILAEVYPQEEEFRKNRQYINVGRYAILPVATSKSQFANYFLERGLNTEAIKQVFFSNIYADKEKQLKIDAPYTVYTRLQKAGVPFVFAKFFDFQQKDIKGTSIAGADEHLVKALLRDPNGVTYLPLVLIYDQQTRKAINGLTVLPVDINGNGRLNDDEKFYGSLDAVIQRLENKESGDIKNIPVEYLHLSVDKQSASQDAIDFLTWVNEHGKNDLHEFGYLLPDASRENEKFNEFASKRKADLER